MDRHRHLVVRAETTYASRCFPIAGSHLTGLPARFLLPCAAGVFVGKRTGTPKTRNRSIESLRGLAAGLPQDGVAERQLEKQTPARIGTRGPSGAVDILQPHAAPTLQGGAGTQGTLMSTASRDQRYLSDAYVNSNPTWDQEDSPWKAAQVWDAIQRSGRPPDRMAEVGCGAGRVLAELRGHLPNTRISGFDIAPAASRFWAQHEGSGIDFRVADFLQVEEARFDLILLLDVVEHLEDPFGFLRQIRDRADQFIFLIPLDLSVVSILRETPLMHVRNKVGHLHYFTKSLALALLDECGFEVIDWRYTNAAVTGSGLSLKARIVAPIRWLFYRINHDFGARLLGGETLIVTAKPASA